MAKLRAYARARGAHALLAEVAFERGNALSGDAAVRAWLEAGRLLREDCGDPKGARRAYAKAMEAAPSDEEAFLGEALCLHELEAWSELEALYRRRLGASSERGEQASLHIYLAEILGEHMEDPNGAVEALVRAAQLDPLMLRVLPQLERWVEVAGAHAELAVVLGDLVMHQPDAQLRAALCVRLAELHLGPLADRDRALTYLRSALVELEVDPTSLESVEDLSVHHEALDKAQSNLREVTEDRRLGPHRVRLERRLSRVYDARSDQHRSLMALTRALEWAPSDRELQQAILRVGLGGERREDVTAGFERAAERTSHPLLRTFLRMRLGYLYADRPDDAIRVFQSVLEEDPSHIEARRRLEPLLEARGDREGLIRLLETAAEQSTTEDLPAVLARLRALYRQTGRDDRHLEEAAPPPPPTRLDTGTIESFEAALEAEHPQTRLSAHRGLVRALIDEDALARAEAAAERGLGWFENDPVLLALLEESHRRRRQWEGVVSTLRRRLSAADGTEQRLALHKALARVLEVELAAEAAALEVLRQAEREGPFDIEVSRSTERLLRARMAWDELVRTLRNRVEHGTATERSEGRFGLARIALEVGFDPESAWSEIEAGLVDQPEHPEGLRLAVEAAVRRGRYDQACSMADRFARCLEGPDAAELFARAGDWAERELQDYDRAERLYESALAANPASASATRALYRLAREREDWSAALLWSMRTVELESPDGTDALIEAARIADKELGDLARAEELLRAVLEVEPQRADLWARCGELARERDALRAASDLETAAQYATDAAQSATWYEEAGRLLEKGGDPERALVAYRAALGLDLARRDAVLSAARLLEGRSAWEEVFELGATFLLHHEASASRSELALTYSRMSRARGHLGEWEGAVRFGRKEVELEPTDEALERLTYACLKAGFSAEAAELCHRRSRRAGADRLALLSRAGVLYGELARDPYRAAVVLEEAQRLDPACVDLAFRVAAYRHQTHEAWAAARAYKLLASVSEGAAKASALRLAAGWLWEHHRDQARELLEQSLDIAPSEDAARDLGTLLEYDGEDDKVARPWFRLAESMLARGRFEVARDAYARAARLAAFRSGDPEVFARAFKELCRLDDDPRWWVLRAHWADALAEEDSEEVEHAVSVWMEVADRVPGHARAIRRLRHWFSRTERPVASRLLTEILGEDPGPEITFEASEPFTFAAATPEARWMERLGPALASSQRDAFTFEQPRRRDQIGEASLPNDVVRALRVGFTRVGRTLPDLFSVTWGPPLTPVVVDGGLALGIRPDLQASPDLVIGAAMVAARLDWASVPVELLEIKAVREALAGGRRRRVLERALGEDKDDIWGQRPEFSLAAYRESRRLRSIHGGLVASVSWSKALNAASTWTGRRPGVEARRSLAAFGTSERFLRWLLKPRSAPLHS